MDWGSSMPKEGPRDQDLDRNRTETRWDQALQEVPVPEVSMTDCDQQSIAATSC